MGQRGSPISGHAVFFFSLLLLEETGERTRERWNVTRKLYSSILLIMFPSSSLFLQASKLFPGIVLSNLTPRASNLSFHLLHCSILVITFLLQAPAVITQALYFPSYCTFTYLKSACGSLRSLVSTTRCSLLLWLKMLHSSLT